jgi:NADPH2:quinone reductase
MKAIICKEYGPIENLEYAEVPDPVAGPGQVLIKTGAVGVNFPDALLVQGLYQAKPPLPFIPGIDVAGSVEALGEGVEGFSVGDRVVASTMMGAYAERVAVDQRATFIVPECVSEEQACTLMCAYGTSHHALKQRANLQAGETLVVLGASGGTGLAAVQIGKAMGAKVIAVCSTGEKLAVAKENGADELVNSKTDDLRKAIKTLTGKKGADVVFDPVGGDAFDQCASAMAWNGRLLVIGFASGRIPNLPVNLPLVKGFSVVGVFWGTFTKLQNRLWAENMVERMGWCVAGKVRPRLDAGMPLGEAAAALEKISKGAVMGKLVLKP